MQDEPKPNLADAMLNGLMAALTIEQVSALGPLLQAGKLAPLINVLHVLAEDIACVINPPPATAPEPQRLPGTDDDRALRGWLEKEPIDGQPN